MSTPVGNFMLTNLEGAGHFIFQRFPSAIETTGRVNWQPQDITIGIKPVFYANREPRQTRIDDLWLDNTESTNLSQSITDQIEALYALMGEAEKGRPPVLLATWGDRQERCVLQDLTINEQMFDADGTPIRARASITLIQFQDEPATRPRRVGTPADHVSI